MLKLSEKNINYLKLFLTGIILIWLFVRSPLNPLYSDSTPGEWAFVKLNFIYWILVSVFLIWIIYFVNKKNFDKYSLFIFTSANFLYISFYIFYGFDVTDTGLSLSKQWAMYNGLWEENFDAIAGTNLIGGLWLKLHGEPMLIWARLGFVIVQTLIVFVSYKIMLLYFKPKQIFPVMLLVSLFLANWYLYFTINYDNLPFLFYLISVYMLLKGLKSHSLSLSKFMFSGLFYSIAVFCKISYAPAILLHLFVIIIHNKIRSDSLIKKQLIYTSAGILSSALFLLFFLIVSGGYNSYLQYFTEIIIELTTVKDKTEIHTHDHSSVFLYVIYKNEVITVVSKIISYVFMLFSSCFLISKFKNFKYVKSLIIVIAFSILYCATIELNEENLFTQSNYTNLISLIASVFCFWILFPTNNTVRYHLTLIVTLTLLFMFSYVGSDLGFRAAFQTGSGLLLFTMPLILINNQKIKLYSYKIDLNIIMYLVLAVFLTASINKKDNLYRETNFFNIRESFEYGPLRGIKSTPARVQAVDSLLLSMNSIPEIAGKKILYTHSNALSYYLTGTNYFLDTPWDILEDYNTLDQKLFENKPDLFVTSLVSHRIREWPLCGFSDSVEGRAKHHYDIYDRFIEENNYKIIYQNFFYTVWAREDYEADKIVEE